MTQNKILRIADIQTGDLLYFDPALEDRCYAFCAERNIDCLPALDDPYTIYLRDEATRKFNAETIGANRIVRAGTNIFEPEMLERFATHPLLMVFDDGEPTGVVHFADYGKPVVSIHLYELFFAYEKALRKLLVSHGLTDADMLAYFEKKKSKDPETFARKIQEYENLTGKEKRAPFEVFLITELIALANHKKLAALGDVGRLRNMVMHARELVNMADPYNDDYIYKFESFQEFFRLVSRFLADFKRVKNQLAFLQ